MHPNAEMRKAHCLPFLKWPGGKRWLATRIVDLVKPALTGTYYEPFLGGGAVFFALNPMRALLSDANAHLVEAYNEVRDNPEAIVRNLKRMRVSSAQYYKIRASTPQTSLGRATRFLYLNRTAYGGMYRVNRFGVFNVPFGGGERTPTPLWESNLVLRASEALKGRIISTADFEEVMDGARSGDVIYCDPTYTVAHNKNGFVRYNEKNFAWSDQERLASAAKRCCRRGVMVIISNAAHHSICDLYPDASILDVTRMSLLGRLPASRRRVTEVLVILKPSPKHKRGRPTASASR